MFAFTSRAKEALLSALEDLREARNEVDDASIQGDIDEVIAHVDGILDYEDQS